MKLSFWILARMKSSKYRNLIKIIGSLVSLILFVYLIAQHDWEIVFSILDQLSIICLFAVFLLYFGGTVVNGIRWLILLNIAKIEVPLIEVFKITYVGLFVSNFLPSTIGGDGTRFVNLLRYDARKRICLASVIIDRFLNIIVMFLILPFAIFAFIPELNQLFLKLFNGDSDSKSRIIQFSQVNILGAFIPKIKNQIRETISLIGIYWKKPKSLILALFVAVIALLFSFSGTYLMAVSLGITVSIFEVIQIASIVYVFSLIPISLNGLGVRELIMTTLYVSLGSTIEEATLLALVTRLLMVIVTSVGAIWLPQLMSDVDQKQIDIKEL